MRKLDVAWVNSGYRQSLSACENAHGGIEQHAEARGYVWTVEGRAGSPLLGALDRRPQRRHRRDPPARGERGVRRDGFGECAQRRGCLQGPVGTALVVELLVLS
ncbi:hypothetical protein ACFU6I_25390 [Streptomyces sp. NPDC057486]|uniref:hypothetical protein n=1 Tax=Streptomyces sp. NPDC057486 TaxID=3346145 RepID=UPI00368E0251